MNSGTLLKAFLAFAVGLALVAMAFVLFGGTGRIASELNPPVMRSYPVAGDHAEQVRDALQSALQGSDGKRVLGRVTLTPNNQLIVTAPESIQRGVSSMLDDVLIGLPGPAPTVKLEAWFVRGVADGVPDGRLAEVEPALATVREAQGVAHFALIEKLALHSRAGNGGLIEGVHTTLNATAKLRRAGKDGHVVGAALQLAVRPMRGELAADVTLVPGELLVLGQSAYAEGNPAGAPPQTLYYIVRATL